MYDKCVILPKVLLDVAVESGFLCPAEGEEGLADRGLDIGGDGTEGAVVLIVALAGVEADEVVLDGAGKAGGDVVVHLPEAEGHADGMVGAVVLTVGLLHLWVPQVDVCDDGVVLGDKVFENAAKAVLAEGARLALADGTFCHHLAYLLFAYPNGCGAGLRHFLAMGFIGFDYIGTIKNGMPTPCRCGIPASG